METVQNPVDKPFAEVAGCYFMRKPGNLFREKRLFVEESRVPHGEPAGHAAAESRQRDGLHPG